MKKILFIGLLLLCLGSVSAKTIILEGFGDQNSSYYYTYNTYNVTYNITNNITEYVNTTINITNNITNNITTINNITNNITSNNITGNGNTSYVAVWVNNTHIASANLYANGSQIGINDITPDALLDINIYYPEMRGLIVQGQNGQTGNLQDWLDWTGHQYAYINATGKFIYNGSEICTALNNLCNTTTPYQSNAAGWTNTTLMTSTNLNVSTGPYLMVNRNSPLDRDLSGVYSRISVNVTADEPFLAINEIAHGNNWMVATYPAAAPLPMRIGFERCTSDFSNCKEEISFSRTGDIYMEGAIVTATSANFSGNVYDNYNRVCTATNGLCTTARNITGSGITNYVARWTNATNLEKGLIYDNTSGVGIGTTTPLTTLDISGTTTIRGSTTPTSGASLELSYVTNTGYVQVYNRSNSLYQDLYIRGKINNLVGTDSFIMSAGVTLNDGPKIQIINANSTGSPTHNGSMFFDYGTYTYDVDTTTAKFALRVMNRSTTTNVMWADARGYVGIGQITGPDTELHVRGGVCIDNNAVCTNPNLGNLDVVGNVTIGEILTLTPRATAPTGTAGMIYYDTSQALCVYNSTAWNKLAGGGSCA